MISVRGLNKSFGGKRALHDLSFDIKPGLMTGFVGGNGAGKTTTMRILLGVLSHDSGEILVDGEPITSDYRAGIGYMPEERGLYPKMPVIDQLVYLARLHGSSAKAAKTRAMNLLERLDLDHRAKDKLEELSLGNQQRAQVAAALVHEPSALVLDEPFSGLDPHAVDITLQVLQETADTGIPVLFSSHQLDVVERLCDVLIILADGRVVASGTRDELIEQHTEAEWELITTAGTDWIHSIPGVTITSSDEGQVRFHTDSVDVANEVLREATSRGPIHSFGPVRHSLHEIFTEVTR